MIWPFDTAPYIRRGHCGDWSTELLATMNTSDVLIGSSFVGISAMIFFILYKRRDVPLWWLVWAIALTTGWCGVTHLAAVLMTWWPAQWVDALARAVTGALCLLVFVLFCFCLKRILLLITPLMTEQARLTIDVSELVEGLDKQRESINEQTRSVLSQVRTRLEKIRTIRNELSQIEEFGESER